MPKAQFSPALFTFLRDLKANNHRAWFDANKPRYESTLRDPALAFIADFAPHLAKVSRHVVADPRPVGGSLFRIHRDTRFARDKSPYKTHAGLHFRHASAKDAHAPGFYLHLEPGGCFFGAGIWRPDGPSQRAIREAIAASPAAWKKAIGASSFKGTFELDGDTLKRVPPGFDKDHPLADDLRRKDFIAVTRLDQKKVCAPVFTAELGKLAKAGAPLMAFLCKALGVPF